MSSKEEAKATEASVDTKPAKESMTLWFNAIYAIVLLFSEKYADMLVENQTLVLALIGVICNIVIRYWRTNQGLRLR
jgi:hypothetical protein